MRFLHRSMMLWVFAGACLSVSGVEAWSAAPQDFADLAALQSSLPALSPRTLDAETAETLALMGLACLDNPEAPPAHTPYLWQAHVEPVPNYQSSRVFYGCLDWHSNVNTVWAMIRILKAYPALPAGGHLREKLDAHLGISNVRGELAYFATPELAHTWMRPYGFAWLLRLQQELTSWHDPQGQRWAANLQPFATFVAGRLDNYFRTNPDQPVRTGAHFNTALAYLNSYDYARLHDPKLFATIRQNALHYYSRDTDCNTDTELGESDFLSACLTEAALMARVLDQPAFVAWLDRFLPPLQGPKFRPLTQTIDPTKAESREARSHYLGLELTRASAMLLIAKGLPKSDARVPVLERLAALHGETAFDLLSAVGYDGTHYATAMTMMYIEPQLADQ